MEPAVATAPAVSPAQGTPKAEEKVVETKPVAAPAAPPAEVKKEEVKAAPEVVEAKPEEPKPVVYDIQLPKEARISEPEVEAIKGYAKENKLSPEQAQGIASFIDSQHNLAKTLAEGAWLDECKNHPTFGKENFPKSCQAIKTMLERTAPKLIPILDKSGFGNKVEVFEFLADLANKGLDDTLVHGKQTVTPDTRTTMQKIADEFNKKG